MALGTGTYAELTPQISVMMVNSSPFSQPQHSWTFQHREHRKEMAVIPPTFVWEKRTPDLSCPDLPLAQSRHILHVEHPLHVADAI